MTVGAIKNIAGNVVLIVFFASVLEMFLPKSSMTKYIQLIMGLFVIVSILNPIIGLLTDDFSLNAFAWEKVDEDAISEILNEGLDLKKSNEAIAVDTIISKMKRQVEALVTLIPGINQAEIKFVLDSDFVHNAKIKKIIIRIKPNSEDSANCGIEPITINTSENKEEVVNNFPLETTERIKEIVSSFYGFDLDIIEVLIE